ncbi:MAG: tetratricopeptide repeat protein, partial [Deltaproteobacteria bacterium]
RFQKAEEIFKRAIAVNPSDDAAYFELGRCYAEVARFKEAEKLLQKAIAINPQNNEAYLELGKYYFDEGLLQDIEDFIQKNIDTPSIKNGEFYFLSGRHYIQVRRYQKAEEMLLKAIELNPNDYYAICALGHLYKKRGESEKAKKTYSLLDAIVLKNDKECTTVGSCYRDAGKLLEAEKLLRRAIKLNPQGINAYRALSQQYRLTGRKQNAENILKKAIAINPDSDKAYFVLGELYVIEGRWSEARKILREMLKLFPEHYKIYKQFAFYYEWEGRFQEAEEMFQEALEMNPMSYRVYIDLGNCYEANGKSKEAETMFLKAITITPKQSYGYMKLGCLYKEMGRLQEAHHAWIKGLEINPRNCRIRSYLYQLYVEQKRLSEAEELLQGPFATALQNYSIYLELGDYGSVAQPQKGLDPQAKINKLVPYETSIINNYRKLREILRQKKIKLAVVQYPCRDIEPLKNIFEDKEGIIFVDNEDLFKTALKHSSYDDYFIDHFAGDFGHCTKKGNRLLADNVANAILKYIGL